MAGIIAQTERGAGVFGYDRFRSGLAIPMMAVWGDYAAIVAIHKRKGSPEAAHIQESD